MNYPFKQIDLSDNKVIRTFSSKTNQEDFSWHKDHQDREIKILDCGDNWKIQFENSLPQNIKKDDVIHIKAKEWHRVIKGTGNLVIKIIKEQ